MVLTDDDPIYSTIVPKIFPFATYRIFLWQVMNNFLEALEKAYKNSEIFRKVMSTINALWHASNRWEATEIIDKVVVLLNGANKRIIRRLAKLDRL